MATTSDCRRRALAQEAFQSFTKALKSDCFPPAGVAGMFDCKTDSTKHTVLVSAPMFMGLELDSAKYMELARVVYGAWVTLLRN
jgi:hypothetical protein